MILETATQRDADGRETRIALFPAAENKPEQINIVDEEQPE